MELTQPYIRSANAYLVGKKGRGRGPVSPGESVVSPTFAVGRTAKRQETKVSGQARIGMSQSLTRISQK